LQKAHLKSCLQISFWGTKCYQQKLSNQTVRRVFWPRWNS